jgi:predicted nuclease with TOPRIM domain
MDNLEVLVDQYKTINSKLDKITDKVEQISTENAVQRVEIDTLKNDIIELQKKQSELKEEIKSVKNNISKLEKQPAESKSKKWDTVVLNILRIAIAAASTLVVTGIIAWINNIIK